jgi:hypothetical protein
VKVVNSNIIDHRHDVVSLLRDGVCSGSMWFVALSMTASVDQNEVEAAFWTVDIAQVLPRLPGMCGAVRKDNRFALPHGSVEDANAITADCMRHVVLLFRV